MKLFERKPHKIYNARVMIGVIAGLIMGIFAQRLVWQRLGFDRLDSQLESLLTVPQGVQLFIGSMVFGLVGGLCGYAIGYLLGRESLTPPPVALGGIAIAAILTMNYDWVLPANLIYLFGFLLFVIEGVVLYQMGRAAALKRSED